MYGRPPRAFDPSGDRLRERSVEIPGEAMPRAMNLEQLSAELDAAKIPQVAGVTHFAGGRLLVTFRRRPRDAERDAVIALVRAHVPQVLQVMPVLEEVG